MNVILKAMKAHKSYVLGNLACNHDSKVKIFGAGGIEVILESMKAHLAIANGYCQSPRVCLLYNG